MTSIKDIASKVQQLFNSAKSNLQSWGQVATQPQLRQEYAQYGIKPTINTISNAFINNQKLSPWRQQIPEVPKVSIPNVNINNKIGSFAVNSLVKPMAESIINTPYNLISGSNLINKGLNTGNSRDLLTGVGRGLEGSLNIATLGSGGSLAEGLIKPTIKQAIIQSGKTGTLIGGAYGLSSGLQEAQNSPDLKSLLKSVGIDIGQGVLLGGALGVAGGAVGGLIGKIKSLTQRPAYIETQLRDRMGRWVAGEKPIKPKGMPINQWDFQIKFNEKYKQNPYTPVMTSDLNNAINYESQKRFGLQVRDINKEKNPLATKEVGGVVEGGAKPINPNLISSAQGIGTGTIPIETKATGAIKEAKNLFSNSQGIQDIQNALRANRGMYDLEKGNLARQSEPLVKAWNKLTPEDHIKFIQDIQSGVPQVKPELQQLADQYRVRFNEDYQLAQTLKPNLPYMDNYFAQSGVWSNPAEAKNFYNKFSLGGNPGALQQRVFPTVQDGINAGLKLKETNPEIIALNSRTQLLKLKMAQDFKDVQLAKGVAEEKINGVLDKYLQRGLKGSKLYQTVREANGALNSLQLGLSGFHVLGTAINASVSKASMAINDLLTGHPISALKNAALTPTASLEYVFKGWKIQKDVMAGNLTPDIENIAGGGGRFKTPSIYYGTGWQDALANMQKAGWQNKLKGGLEVIPATIRTVAKPIMEWWVPKLKNGAAADLIASNLRKLPKNASEEMINSVRSKAIDSIDNRFGQLNVDNLFWNRTMTDLMSLGMRSPGWNIGTVKELGGGAMDWFTKSQWKNLASGKGISNRSAYAISLPIIVGMLAATYQYLKTGQGPTELKDYFYPKTGQVDPKTGNPERVAFPTYAKDVYSFFTSPVQTVKNKLSPMIGIGSQILSNKDYYGNQIADPYAGKLIQAGQIGKYVGTAITPFSITGGARRVNPNLQARAENFMGIIKAPGNITNPGQQDYYNASAELENLQSQYSSTAKKVASGSLTPAQGQAKLQDLQTRMNNAKAVINKGLPNVAGSTNQGPITSNNPSALGGPIYTANGEARQTTITQPVTLLQGTAIVNLPGGTLGYVDSDNTLHKNLTQDEANIMAVKDQVKVNKKGMMVGNSYVYLDKDTVKTVDLTPIKSPELTGNSALDKLLTSKYKSALTTQTNGIVALYQKGELTATEAEKMLNSLAKKKAGTIKAKAIKKIAYKKITIPKIKIANNKIQTIKIKSFPKLKVAKAKTTTLKVKSSKIKLARIKPLTKRTISANFKVA